MKAKIAVGIAYGVAMPLIGGVGINHPAWWIGCVCGFLCAMIEWRSR